MLFTAIKDLHSLRKISVLRSTFKTPSKAKPSCQSNCATWSLYALPLLLHKGLHRSTGLHSHKNGYSWNMISFSKQPRAAVYLILSQLQAGSPNPTCVMTKQLEQSRNSSSPPGQQGAHFFHQPTASQGKGSISTATICFGWSRASSSSTRTGGVFTLQSAQKDSRCANRMRPDFVKPAKFTCKKDTTA